MAQDLDLNIQITAAAQGAITALSRIEKSVARTGKKFESIGRSLTSVIGTAAVGGFFAKIAKDASDTQETLNKFNVVFQDVAGSASKAAKDLARDFGLSQNAAKTLLSDTGDLLTGFGFTGESALELSTNVQKLAVDLASFTNFSGGASGASAALTKALLGETESLKSLGIAINQDLVKKKVLELATQGVTFATEKQAKAQATYLLALEQSKNAIGDFARSSDSFANQIRIAQANLSDLSSDLGSILLPLFTKMISKITEVIKSFKDLSTESKIYALASVVVAASIGPLLIAFGKLIQVLGFALSAVRKLAAGLVLLTTPIGLVVAAIAIFVAGLAVAGVRFLNLKKAGVDSLGAIKIVLLDIADVLNTVLVKSFQFFINTALRGVNLLNQALGKPLVPLLDLDGFGENIDAARAKILEGFNITEEDVVTVKDTIINTVGGAVDTVREKVNSLVSELAGSVVIPTTGVDKVVDVITKGKDEAKSLGDELKESGPKLAAGGLTSALSNIADGTKSAKEGFEEFANSFLSRIAQMITESLILQAINSALPGASSGSSTPAAAPSGFATGGFVSGPGSGTSDSIPAYLSNGEYVLTASATKNAGIGFLNFLNNMGKASKAPPVGSLKGIRAFRDGGPVQASGSEFVSSPSEPLSVNIQNSGSEKEATQVSAERDGSGIVVNVILEDISRNGPIARGMQQSFGLKRGARK